VFVPDLIVRSRRVVTPLAVRPATIHIRSGRIIGVVDYEDIPAGCPVDDAGGQTILPGLVDTHVHVTSSSVALPDAFEATTRAAAAGGVTTIIDMPPSGGPATSIEALEVRRRAAADRSFVDVGFWAGLDPGNVRDLPLLLEAGVLGFANCDRGHLGTLMQAVRRMDAMLLVRAELVSAVSSRTKTAETEAIGLVIELCRQHQTRTHIVHLSSSDALAPLFHARAARLPITAETCPHYLCLVADEVRGDANGLQCKPPLRDRENREFLWAAVANRLIQVIASDHGCGSIALLSSMPLSLSATWSEAHARGRTLSEVTEWMCRAPSRLAGLARKGQIEVGYDADLVLFDSDAEFQVDSTSLEPTEQWTPFLGRRLRGVVERTYLRGIQIYARGSAWGSPHGKLVARAKP